MKNKLLLLAFLLSYSFQIDAQNLESQFQNVLDELYKANPESVGLMVHIESPDQGISWSGTVGYADKNAKTKLDVDQPVLIASSIKMHVSASILRLVEMKKITLNQPIRNLLTDKTRTLFENDDYELDSIQVQHLLSHTSGIEDYISSKNVESYFAFIDKNKKYRWTRDEQLERTVKLGTPLGKPGTLFNYADANYLLLTEIIETVTRKKFYKAMRKLLRYKQLDIDNTWFYTLEKQPKKSKPLAHQYWGKKSWDSYDIDPSFDLYGGGGIACTTKDLARFSYHFFNGNIVKDKTVQDLIFTEIPTKGTALYPYFLGLSQDNHNGMNAFGHGGFWGTVMLHYPEINTSISVYVLERDKNSLRRDILQQMSKIVKENYQKNNNHNETIKDYIDNITDFSGTVIVTHNHKIVASKANGFASKEYKINNELNTKFNIASITKTFTAVATLQLYDKGLIDIQKTVGEYLPDYPNKIVRDSVTIHQLLTHTSGLKPFYGNAYLEANKLELKTVRDFVPLFANEELMFSPGSEYYYNGSGFVILGLIIEKVSGQNYYDYLEKNVFEPTNMLNTLAIPTDSIIGRKASGYTSFWGDNDYYSRNDFYTSMASPAGSHYSTVDDLLNFSVALRNGKLIKPETYQLMTSPKVRGFNTHIGYGIDIDKRYDETIIGHSGGWFGVRAEWMDFLGSDYTIIVLSNEDDNGKTKASKVIEDLKVIVGGEQLR